MKGLARGHRQNSNAHFSCWQLAPDRTARRSGHSATSPHVGPSTGRMRRGWSPCSHNGVPASWPGPSWFLTRRGGRPPVRTGLLRSRMARPGGLSGAWLGFVGAEPAVQGQVRRLRSDAPLRVKGCGRDGLTGPPRSPEGGLSLLASGWPSCSDCPGRDESRLRRRVGKEPGNAEAPIWGGSRVSPRPG
jgi:hypothetical protein